jgi:hypothetical protein
VGVGVAVGGAVAVARRVGVAVAVVDGVGTNTTFVGVALGIPVGVGVAVVGRAAAVSAGQMFSRRNDTHRCSSSAVWMAAFSELGKLSKPLEPLPPAQAESDSPRKNHISQRYRRTCMIASLRTSWRSPAR